MKRSVVVAILCLVCSFSNGQRIKKIQNLAIGDKVPDIPFAIDDKKGRPKWTKMSAFRGKLVILDFWGTYCAGCIQAFPKLDSLQREFNRQIQIILVNTQPRKKFDEYAAMRKRQHNEYGSIPNLPLVNSDKVLGALFQHVFIPHEVWIDAKGKVTAITEGKYVTRANILKKLKNSDFQLPQKSDMMNHNSNLALLPQIYSTLSNPLKFYSSILKYRSGLDGTTTIYNIDSSDGTIRVTRPFAPILFLYSDALSRWGKGFGADYPFEDPYWEYGKRLILEVSDSSKYIWPPDKNEDWNIKHCFGYEAVWPLAQADSVYDFMLEDLNRYFNLNGHLQTRMVKTMSLVRTSNADKMKAKYDTTSQLREDTSIHYRLYDGNMALFRNQIAGANKSTPLIFVDNTHYDGYIDIELSSSLDDLVSLKKELKSKYDLDIVEKDQPVEMMVITEKNYTRSK